MNMHEQAQRIVGALALAGYIGCVFGANWAGQHYGIVPIGFGLEGPAGLYFVGLAFGLRDLVQETWDRRLTVAAVLVGAALSYIVAPSFAFASGLAFLVSETADLAVYTPLRERRWMLAVIGSNVVGAIVDSVLFLWIAFGWDSVGEFWFGQTVGKVYLVAPAVALIWAWRHRDLLVGLRPTRTA